MKRTKHIIAITFLTIVQLTCTNVNAQKWGLACQAYSFKDNTVEETLQALNTLGIEYVELFKKQKMSADDSREINYTMPDEQIEELKDLLEKYNVKALSYGVITVQKPEQWEQLFQFAQKLGIQIIVSEPTVEQLELVDKLCQKYKIKLAIHNHAKPKKYWDPSMAKEALEGRSKYMGVCPDVGHWKRSGFNVAEGLKLLEGRIIEVHIKDVTNSDVTGKPTVLGTGVIDWESVFAELRRQNFKGKIVIEHAGSWDNPLPDMKKNVAFYNSISN